ncbi:MAG: MerR family DNA-binding transcriptional regulator [Candidatus Omnitrophica bacterium]|nr:MerR family DNA-binding transcriptional regulator [Candidatus Omnitrophota bacterium]
MKTRKILFLSQGIAKILGVTRRTLYNWEKAGKIPRAKRDKMSNYRVYAEEDVKKLKKLTGRL